MDGWISLLERRSKTGYAAKKEANISLFLGRTQQKCTWPINTPIGGRFKLGGARSWLRNQNGSQLEMTAGSALAHYDGLIRVTTEETASWPSSVLKLFLLKPNCKPKRVCGTILVVLCVALCVENVEIKSSVCTVALKPANKQNEEKFICRCYLHGKDIKLVKNLQRSPINLSWGYYTWQRFKQSNIWSSLSKRNCAWYVTQPLVAVFPCWASCQRRHPMKTSTRIRPTLVLTSAFGLWS